MDVDIDLPNTVQARFKSDTGEETGSPLDLPLNVTKDQLQLICNALLHEVPTSLKLLITNILLDNFLLNTNHVTGLHVL